MTRSGELSTLCSYPFSLELRCIDLGRKWLREYLGVHFFHIDDPVCKSFFCEYARLKNTITDLNSTAFVSDP